MKYAIILFIFYLMNFTSNIISAEESNKSILLPSEKKIIIERNQLKKEIEDLNKILIEKEREIEILNESKRILYKSDDLGLVYNIDQIYTQANNFYNKSLEKIEDNNNMFIENLKWLLGILIAILGYIKYREDRNIKELELKLEAKLEKIDLLEERMELKVEEKINKVEKKEEQLTIILKGLSEKEIPYLSEAIENLEFEKKLLSLSIGPYIGNRDLGFYELNEELKEELKKNKKGVEKRIVSYVRAISKHVTDKNIDNIINICEDYLEEILNYEKKADVCLVLSALYNVYKKDEKNFIKICQRGKKYNSENSKLYSNEAAFFLSKAEAGHDKEESINKALELVNIALEKNKNNLLALKMKEVIIEEKNKLNVNIKNEESIHILITPSSPYCY